MKAIGYRRISTETNEDGTSLTSQSQRISAMATVKEYQLDEIITDVESGKSLNRPGMKRIIELVTAKAIDAVIITKLDRLTRSLRDLLTLLDLFKAHGVALISLSESLDTETPIGRLLIGVLGSVNEFERETIAARMADGRKMKASQGGCVGAVPYGYSKAGEGRQAVLVENAAEMVIVDRIKALTASGESIRGIASILNSEGIKTRKGTAWTPTQVHRIVHTPQKVCTKLVESSVEIDSATNSDAMENENLGDVMTLCATQRPEACNIGIVGA